MQEPAWAVASCSISPQPKEVSKISSSKPCDRVEKMLCTSIENRGESHDLGALGVHLRLRESAFNLFQTSWRFLTAALQTFTCRVLRISNCPSKQLLRAKRAIKRCAVICRMTRKETDFLSLFSEVVLWKTVTDYHLSSEMLVRRFRDSSAWE